MVDSLPSTSSRKATWGVEPVAELSGVTPTLPEAAPSALASYVTFRYAPRALKASLRLPETFWSYCVKVVPLATVPSGLNSTESTASRVASGFRPFSVSRSVFSAALTALRCSAVACWNIV